MGYAIFAARKLMLTSRISNLNFRIMCLSQKQQSLADQSSMMQQMIGSSMGGSMFGNMFGNMFGMGGNMFGMGNMYGNMGYIGNMFNMLKNNQDFQKYLAISQEMQAYGRANLYAVNQQEKQIEMQMKRLETQLSAATKELEKVEQAEDKQIERSAPKYA